jgi:hypothetical protein
MTYISLYNDLKAAFDAFDNSERRRIALMAGVRYHNGATNDGQDGPSSGYEAPTDTGSLSTTMRGGGVVGVVKNTPAGIRTEPRCFFWFSNAFRLPGCRIVPVPYGVNWYNPTRSGNSRLQATSSMPKRPDTSLFKTHAVSKQQQQQQQQQLQVLTACHIT